MEEKPDISFVVIGLNEGKHLGACLESVRRSFPKNTHCEVIYVDGGSSDDSMNKAQQAGADRVAGGDRRRSAAENRNLGLTQASGEFVQFVDGDMILDPQWPAAAWAFLGNRPDVAAVCGELIEFRDDAFYKAMQLDWRQPEGPVAFCGGAAMFRVEALRGTGGFPEEVRYGEEPYLCWRLRHMLGWSIWHLKRPMAKHDLAYRGFRDYWRRTVRCGETYAEIAARCAGGPERLWLREVFQNLAWAALIVVAVAALAGPFPANLILMLLLLMAVGRKGVQCLRRGERAPVAGIYALHTYFAKLPIAWGIVRWTVKQAFRRVGASRT